MEGAHVTNTPLVLVARVFRLFLQFINIAITKASLDGLELVNGRHHSPFSPQKVAHVWE